MPENTKQSLPDVRPASVSGALSPDIAIIRPELAERGARLVEAIIRGDADPHLTELGAFGISGA